MKIAIIEDSAEYRLFLQNILAEEDIDFYVTGEDFDSDIYDVIIIDYRLPGEDGEIVLAYIEKDLAEFPHYAIMSKKSELVEQNKIQPAIYCNIFNEMDVLAMISWIESINDRLKVRQLFAEAIERSEESQRILKNIYFNLN